MRMAHASHELLLQTRPCGIQMRNLRKAGPAPYTWPAGSSKHCSKYIMTSQNYSSETWHLCYLLSAQIMQREENNGLLSHLVWNRIAPRPIGCFHREPNSGFCINKYLTVDFSSFPFLILRIKIRQNWASFGKLLIFHCIFLDYYLQLSSKANKFPFS